jgi:dihydrofolate reductase
VTYEEFAQAWPPRAGDEIADRINSLPKYVASRTLQETTWNATLIKGDVVEEVTKLKEEQGENILKYGTGEFSRTLLEHKLVDEYHFWIFPVLAGSGTRLFDGLDPTHLNLVDTTRFNSGIVVMKYTPK